MSERQDRRQEILGRAAQLFAAKGVNATTVRDIAEAVGLLPGSLYHHFESKDAMVDEILTGYLDDLLGRYRAAVAAEPGPAVRIRSLIRVSLATAEAHPHATEIYQNEPKYLRSLPRFGPVLAAGAEVQKLWLGVIVEGARSGDFRSDIDPKVFYRMIRDALWLSVRWHQPGGAYSSARLADDCAAIFLDGFAAKGASASKQPTRPARPASASAGDPPTAPRNRRDRASAAG